MRRLRSVIVAGLVIAGFHIPIVFTGIGAEAASDCPCKKIGPDVCIPDMACEERELQLREIYESTRRQRYEEYGYRREGNILPPGSAQGGPYRAQPLPAPAAEAPPPAAGAPPSAPVAGGAPAPAPPPRPFNIPAKAQARPPAGLTTTPLTTRLRILETGYSHLKELGAEASGYGLYSYAILPTNSARAASFLAEVFRDIPAIGDTGALPIQLNIFYVPLSKEKENEFTTLLQTSGGDAAKIGAEYAKSLYDYKMARTLLDHVCNPPDDSVRALCDGELSRGPYIFTYTAPASRIEPVPPPFLFVDLSDIHEKAFVQMLDGFRAQVKREDISDQARIRTLQNKLLQIALVAADWVSPIQKALTDIVHLAGGGNDKK
jgi:hypothetical protein